MINCIAIDDSPLALELLENYISKIEYLHLIKSCTNALEGMEILKKGGVDLLFLDIQMPDITGIDLLKSLETKPKVIFTTAYPDYAIEGFNYNASDYLLKPFAFERFTTAVEKVKRQLDLEKKEASENESMFIKSGYEVVKILINDIQYIEALKDYIQIFTTEKKTLSLMSMKEILDLLPQDNFIRVHRSYIVSVGKITKVGTKKVFVAQKEIPVGDIYKDEFQKHLREKKII